MNEAQRKYRSSPKGLATSRARDRARAEDRRQPMREYAAIWRRKNPDYAVRRYLTDENTRISNNLHCSLRSAVSRLIRRRQWQWHTNSEIGRLIGCGPQEFLGHIEAQFQPGMSWQNRGGQGWQIAHIKPAAQFDLTDPAQRAACFHFSNLQPLWPDENRRRRRKD